MADLFTKKKKTISVGKEHTCEACGLYQTCTSPKMVPYGAFKKGIMIVGEAPGEVEDRTGRPWQGKTGKLLQRTLSSLGINLFEDCVCVNAVRCRPMTENNTNRTPTNHEVDCCRIPILKTIERYKPQLIILLGNVAVYSIIGHRWKRDLGTITKWRGWTIPDQDFKAWICPTFHPSFVERSKYGGPNNTIEVLNVEETIWTQDLDQALKIRDKELPIYKEPVIDIIDNLSVLDQIKDTVAFDYETTGRKPHAEGHRIVSCAVADTADHAYVFIMPAIRHLRLPLINLLSNPRVGKMAHSMKYEETWSIVRLEQPVINWVWDSMLAAHMFDNRVGVTSLKFQTYVQFGVSDYSSGVDSYLHSKDPDNANSLNQIYDLLALPDGPAKLLRYNALDAINEYRLAMLQRDLILPF